MGRFVTAAPAPRRYIGTGPCFACGQVTEPTLFVEVRRKGVPVLAEIRWDDDWRLCAGCVDKGRVFQAIDGKAA